MAETVLETFFKTFLFRVMSIDDVKSRGVLGLIMLICVIVRKEETREELRGVVRRSRQDRVDRRRVVGVAGEPEHRRGQVVASWCPSRGKLRPLLLLLFLTCWS